MTQRTPYLAAGAMLALAAVSTPRAQAAYVVTFQEVGANVVEVGGGTIDLTDLTAGADVVTNAAGIIPAEAFFESGDAGVDIKDYFGVSSFSTFGPGETFESPSGALRLSW
jgi:hypothetical protein